MARLTVHLQNGFQNDDVVIRSDDRELLRRAGVTTRRILGLAEHTAFDLPDGPLSLDVSIPNRGIEKHLDLDLKGDVHVGLSVDQNGLQVITRDKPFGYG